MSFSFAAVLRHQALVLLFGCLTTLATVHAQAQVAVAAASDLKFVMDELVASYAAETGQKVRMTYGSSGNFWMQISQGAPFDIFLSADESLVFTLADKGLTQGRGKLYGLGRLVLFAPQNSALAVDARLDGLKQALGKKDVRKFAIANPTHAPYGRAAQEVLEGAGLWSAIEPQLVLGENVSQAAQFAMSGSAQGGIFALSLMLSPSLSSAGRYVVLPESLHQPLRQRMVLTRRAGPAAVAFYNYLQQAPARAIFKRYGFSVPATE